MPRFIAFVVVTTFGVLAQSHVAPTEFDAATVKPSQPDATGIHLSFTREGRFGAQNAPCER